MPQYPAFMHRLTTTYEFRESCHVLFSRSFVGPGFARIRAGSTDFRETIMQRMFLTAVLVHDYDEAIAFYVEKLGFEVRLDKPVSDIKRWVVLAPHGGGQGCILLAKPEAPEQIARIGRQTGAGCSSSLIQTISRGTTGRTLIVA